MSENITGFVLWLLVGVAFIGLGFYARSSKKVMGFWANAKVFAVTDVKKYNNAVAKLWFIVAGILEITGIPMLFLEQNSPLFVPIIFAVIIEVFVMIVVYLKIEAQYKK